MSWPWMTRIGEHCLVRLCSSMVAPPSPSPSPSAASAPSPAVSVGSSDAMDITNFTRMFSLLITLMVQSRGQSCCGVIDA